jgi:hypothetical protein
MRNLAKYLVKMLTRRIEDEESAEQAFMECLRRELPEALKLPLIALLSDARAGALTLDEFHRRWSQLERIGSASLGPIKDFIERLVRLQSPPPFSAVIGDWRTSNPRLKLFLLPAVDLAIERLRFQCGHSELIPASPAAGGENEIVPADDS